MAPRTRRRLNDAQRAVYAQILGVAVNADQQAIARARKALSRLHHPDRAGGDTARMAAINEAADALEEHLRTPKSTGAPPNSFSFDRDWETAAAKANAELVLRFAKEHIDALRAHDPLAMRFGLPLRNPPAFRVHVHKIKGLTTQNGQPHVFYSTRMEPGINLFSHPVFLGDGRYVATHLSDHTFFTTETLFSGTKTFALAPQRRSGAGERYKGGAFFHFGTQTPLVVDVHHLEQTIQGTEEPAELSHAVRRLVDGRLPQRIQPIVACFVFSIEHIVRSIAKRTRMSLRTIQRLFASSAKKLP